MTQRHLIYWLALQRIFSNQPIIAKQLLDFYQTPDKIFEYSNYEQVRCFNDWATCEQDLKICQQQNINILTLADENYPAQLKEIYDCPVVLMIKGDINALTKPGIAIVGSRRATSLGKEIAFELGQELAEFGLQVTSGMAYGIDISAHLGALSTGSTIAIWGSGLNCCYPPEFKTISQQIAGQGCVVSEFPLDFSPQPQNFPQRNRIISGLSLGVVVVEAAKRSGSLITARMALEQGREVFAVPGLAKGVTSRGTHELLKKGAALVETGAEIIEIIAPILPVDFKNPRHLQIDEHNRHPILKHLSQREAYFVDYIVEKSGLSSAEALQQLTELMLQGEVEELPGKRFRRK
ncbi:MAG: DNA-processing protein DprA [Pseudomonadota bacterium]